MEKYKSQDFKSKHSLKYTDEFKHMVCKAYLEGNKSKPAIWREYIGSEAEHGNLTRWLKKMGYLSAENIAIASIAPMSKQDSQQPDIEELQKKIQELEKSLEDSKLQGQMYKRMIELAEDRLKINIRKKFNTK